MAGPPPPAAAVTVGLDLGTSGMKAVAVGSDGRVLARARCSYPTHRPEPAAAEQDPGDWRRATSHVMRALAAAVAPTRWRAIGLSAMLPTLVAMDAAGEAVGPAITWQDGRSEPEGEAYRQAAGELELYRRTGQWVDGRYLVPMMTRHASSRPALRAATRLVGAKDYLFHVLTGELLTDPSTATGFGCFDLHTGGWDQTDSPTRWTLPTVAPAATSRPIRVELAAEWGIPAELPIVLGAADSVLGAHALGVRQPGQVAYLAGTSTVVLGRVRTPQVDASHRYLVTPMVDGGFGAEMDLLATGSALAWWAGLLGMSGPAELAVAAAQARPGSGPVFLPYLAPGEQGALWEPDLSGAIVGLMLQHSRPQVARALQTGIVLESARCIAVLSGSAATGGSTVPPGEIRVGGGAADRAFAQDLASATGRVVRISPDEPDQSAIGAAWLAAGVVGLSDPGSERTVAGAVSIEPERQDRALWAELFGAHESARRALRGLGGPEHEQAGEAR